MINWIKLFGISAFIFLLMTVSLGVLMVKGRPVFIYHKISAITTLTLYSLHLAFIYL